MARVQDFLNRRYQGTPRDEINIAGFTALVRVRETTRYQADPTVNFTERGAPLSDHIVYQPLVLEIEGNVGDLHLRPSPILEDLRRLQAEVGAVTAFAPARTQAQQQRVNALINDGLDAVRLLDNVLDTGEQALRFLGNQDREGKPLGEQFLDAMEALYYGQQLFAVDMPYRRYTNMAMVELTVETDNTDDSTQFNLTVQEFPVAATEFVEVGPAPNPANALDGQTDGRADKGAQAGEGAEQSLIFSLIGR